MLGAFLGLRARHFQDVGKYNRDVKTILASEPDWLLARGLFPASRVLYKNQFVVAVLRGERLFEPDEAGHPSSVSACIDEIQNAKWSTVPKNGDDTSRIDNDLFAPRAVDDLFSQEEFSL
jgi:hypothetical protein